MKISYLQKKYKSILGKIILLRADLNIEPEYKKSSLRLYSTIPTILKCMNYGERVIIVSHRGRPSKNDRNKKEYSLAPFAKLIEKEINHPVTFIPNYSFSGIVRQLFMEKPKVALLENIRFFSGEEKNSNKFSKQLASLSDIYVNDAFANCHRKHASMVAITRHLPSYAGLLLEKEIKGMEYAMRNHRKPLTIILGGAKIKTKLGVINYFKDKADNILIGGGVANTFLKESGVKIGASLYDKTVRVSSLLKLKNIHIPSDWICEGDSILDIGRNTARDYSNIIKNSKTIIWNGPMGMIEKKKFSYGTKDIALAIGKKKNTAFTLAGGGETTSIIVQNNLEDTFDLISTGGGAMLEYLSGKKLPAIEALRDR